MSFKRFHQTTTVLTALAVIFFPSATSTPSQVAGRDVTILVTVHPHKGRALAANLRPEDFTVREEKSPQRILSVKRPTEAPPLLAVLIQDDLVTRVGNEIKGIKEFLRSLPEGSRVMTGYLTVGSMRVTQDFTADRAHAAESLRITQSSKSATPYNPYIGVIETLRHFDAQGSGRRIVLLISDGLDVSRGFDSASPTLSVDLDRAIREAQRRGVAVFPFYAPSVGLTSRSQMAINYGQGSLNRLADETGGQAFFDGTDLVSFDPYFKELDEILDRQWLITYSSTGTGSGFRRIEVSTDFDVDLLHPAGYQVRD
jgi:VWFA-related protein